MQIICDVYTTFKIIKNYIELTPSSRTTRGTDEAAADNTQSLSSMKIDISYIFRKLILFIFSVFGYHKYGQYLRLHVSQ